MLCILEWDVRRGGLRWSSLLRPKRALRAVIWTKQRRLGRKTRGAEWSLRHEATAKLTRKGRGNAQVSADAVASGDIGTQETADVAAKIRWSCIAATRARARERHLLRWQNVFVSRVWRRGLLAEMASGKSSKLA